MTRPYIQESESPHTEYTILQSMIHGTVFYLIPDITALLSTTTVPQGWYEEAQITSVRPPPPGIHYW